MLYSGRHVLIRNIEDETQITVNACKISIYHGWPLDECKRVSNSSSDATVDGVCVAGVRRWASPQVITSLCSTRQLIPTLYFAIFWWEGFFNSNLGSRGVTFVFFSLKGTFERNGSVVMILQRSTTTTKLYQSKHLQAWNKKACTI